MWTQAQVVVCVARSDGGAPAAPCGTDASGQAYVPATVNVYLADAEAVAAVTQATQGPDWDLNREYWGETVGSVLLLFMAAYGAKRVASLWDGLRH